MLVLHEPINQTVTNHDRFKVDISILVLKDFRRKGRDIVTSILTDISNK